MIIPRYIEEILARRWASRHDVRAGIVLISDRRSQLVEQDPLKDNARSEYKA